ncbi:t41 [Tupaiid betaherpesvirus 1]|uniref:T41 n=1 Tax=Tupaiid herpesvirus 1 (strain 1) TaxID=10397 RepID=Q91TQ2_TUHV1|nr:t41 [Tupaiid betaherpesvirus 1]AAK57085.1 t41 [Tupaiid betaherpesvirus 1]
MTRFLSHGDNAEKGKRSVPLFRGDDAEKRNRVSAPTAAATRKPDSGDKLPDRWTVHDTPVQTRSARPHVHRLKNQTRAVLETVTSSLLSHPVLETAAPGVENTAMLSSRYHRETGPLTTRRSTRVRRSRPFAPIHRRRPLGRRPGGRSNGHRPRGPRHSLDAPFQTGNSWSRRQSTHRTVRRQPRHTVARHDRRQFAETAATVSGSTAELERSDLHQIERLVRRRLHRTFVVGDQVRKTERSSSVQRQRVTAAAASSTPALRIRQSPSRHHACRGFMLSGVHPALTGPLSTGVI